MLRMSKEETNEGTKYACRKEATCAAYKFSESDINPPEIAQLRIAPVNSTANVCTDTQPLAPVGGEIFGFAEV